MVGVKGGTSPAPPPHGLNQLLAKVSLVSKRKKKTFALLLLRKFPVLIKLATFKQSHYGVTVYNFLLSALVKTKPRRLPFLYLQRTLTFHASLRLAENDSDGQFSKTDL